MTSLTVEQRLDRLESIEAIRQLKARYCAGCDDDHNPETLAPLFDDDAVWEASGIGRFEGRAAIKGYFGQLRASGRLRNSAHNAMNPLIEVDGNEATGHWRLIMLYTANLPDGGVQYFRIVGWYRESYLRRDGQWRFRSLFCQVEEHAPYLIEASRG
ncbi:MAG: nuclear transport factor 2 family protein [Pseudomonadales bacterium]